MLSVWAGGTVTVIVVCRSCPSRQNCATALCPAGISAVRMSSARGLVTGTPASETSTSPGCNLPAAGPSAAMPPTSAPELFGRPSRLLDRRRHLLRVDAEPAARHAAGILQFIRHRHGHGGGDGEADADRAAGGRVDRRIHADHLALQVEERAAGIAAIDRRVGLDEIVVGAFVDVAVHRADDAGRGAARQAERVADRQHPVADPQICRNCRRSRTAVYDPASIFSTARSAAVSRPTRVAGRIVPSCKVTVIEAAPSIT